MRRVAAALLLAAAIVPLTAAAAPAPARLQVSADEFSLALSRTSLKSGPAIVELVNYGEDDHDLALRRVARGARTYRIGIVLPGRTGDLEARLLPGTYRLWCTLAGHRAQGMAATLRVRTPAS
jgi:hypothetical protein